MLGVCRKSLFLNTPIAGTHTHTHTVPVKYPVICLSRPLNCCLYFSLEAWGTAQSLGPESRGDITDGDDEAELEQVSKHTEPKLGKPQQ